MSQSRFFEPPVAMTVAEVVALTGAKVAAGADIARRIANIAPLDRAEAGDLTFVESTRYLDRLKTTRAAACLMTEAMAKNAPPSLIVLLTRDPQAGFTAVARKMYANALRPASLFGTVGIAPTALVDPAAKIDPTAIVDPGAMIAAHAEIGAGSVIGAGAVIGPRVRIGRDCSIGAHTSITHATIGDRVIVHAGCRIGQDGFGYTPSKQGHVKIPQVGGVVIHDDVEIGAGTAIDRGGMRDTVIGEGTKIDNLVQIGHNCVIGRHCVIVAQSGISGSVTIEDFVLLGGAAGIAPQVTIGKGARLAARAGVISDVPAGQDYGGYPAIPHRKWLRQQIAIERLVTRGKPRDDSKD
jgi:UDP-3-O-[3-hydroxymyristoyl] glucosamine N-acyltransferase